MNNIVKIDNIYAPDLDVYARLTQAQLKNMRDVENGLFIAEGVKVTEIALNSGIEPVSFLVEERHIEGKASAILRAYPHVPIYTADSNILKTLTGYELTRGFLCAMRRPKTSRPESVCKDAHRLAVLEDIVDASNLGAIFRSAAALGIDGILLSPSCCDPLYRKAVRTSMGTVFQIPWARFNGHWPDDGLSFLREQGFKSVSLALRKDALSIEEPMFTREDRLAIILGTEGNGLNTETIEKSDYSIYIPMHNKVDSLNVAAAAAVAFWQLRSK